MRILHDDIGQYVKDNRKRTVVAFAVTLCVAMFSHYLWRNLTVAGHTHRMMMSFVSGMTYQPILDEITTETKDSLSITVKNFGYTPFKVTTKFYTNDLWK